MLYSSLYPARLSAMLRSFEKKRKKKERDEMQLWLARSGAFIRRQKRSTDSRTSRGQYGVPSFRIHTYIQKEGQRIQVCG